MSTQQPLTALPRPQPSQYTFAYNHTIRQQWATADCSGFKPIQPQQHQHQYQQQAAPTTWPSTGKYCTQLCDSLSPLSEFELSNEIHNSPVTERVPTPFPQSMLDTDDEDEGSEEDAPKLCKSSRKYTDDNL